MTFAGVCVDEGPEILEISKRWPHLRFYRADAMALRRLKINFVPSRFLLDDRSRLRRSWTGHHGSVVFGKHGASIKNGSHTLIHHLLTISHTEDLQKNRHRVHHNL